MIPTNIVVGAQGKPPPYRRMQDISRASARRAYRTGGKQDWKHDSWRSCWHDPPRHDGTSRLAQRQYDHRRTKPIKTTLLALPTQPLRCPLS